MSEVKKFEGFCTRCGGEIEKFEGLQHCPHCGAKSAPCSYDNQFDISINLQELKILTIWAECYAMEQKGKDRHVMTKTLQAIGKRITQQVQPKMKERVILFLTDEINSMKEKRNGDKTE